MDVRIEAYDRLVIVDLSGPVSAEDLESIDAELPTLCKDAGAVVVGLNRAQCDANIFAGLLLLRERHKIPKTKLVFASKTLSGADAKTKTEALRILKTAESERVIDIFAATKQLRKVDDALKTEELKVSNLLRTAFGQKSSDQPLSNDERTAAETRIEERIKRLQYLNRILGSEVEALLKQRVEISEEKASDGEYELNRIRQKALSLLKELGLK